MGRYTLEVARYSGQSQKDLSPLFADYTYGRYCADWSLDIQASRRLERDRLFAYLQPNAASCWVATERDRIVGVLGLRKCAWDTAFWGVDYVTIDHLYACGSGEGSKKFIMDELVDAADQWCRDEKVGFVVARPDALDLDAIHALESHSFRYIETTVTSSYDLRRTETCQPVNCQIRAARPDEADFLMDITKDAFITHRFYADTRFPKERVDNMYREWVRSSLESAAWTTIVLEAEDKVRGFFIYRLEDLSSYFRLRFAKWRLAALASVDQGKGYGIQLFQGAMQFVRDQAEIVDSGLTIRNTRSLNLHNKLGFRILCSSVTFHQWYS